MAFIILVAILYGLLQPGGAWHFLLESEKYANARILLGGTIAWSGVLFVIGGIWYIVELVLDALTHHFHYLPLLEAAGILMGIAFLYQMIISSFTGDSGGGFLFAFVQLLAFRNPSVRRTDIFEQVEQFKMQRTLREERERTKRTSTSHDSDPKMHSGF